MKTRLENDGSCVVDTDRIVELLQWFNERAPIVKYFGMKLSFTDDGIAVVRLPYNPNLDHAFGTTHGGISATLLDTAGSFTAAAAHKVHTRLVTSHMSIHLLRPAIGTSLHAVGRLLRSGKGEDVCEMQLFNEKGRLLARAAGWYVALTEAHSGENELHRHGEMSPFYSSGNTL